MTEVYRNAFTEVSELLKFVSPDLLKKIPKSFLDFIEEQKSETYITNFNMNLQLSEQNLLKETRIILSLIYRDYLCDKEKSKKLKMEDIRELEKKQKDLCEKYNTDSIFKKK